MNKLPLLARLLLTGCDSTPNAIQPKALIIGMDGVQWERYEGLEDTNLKLYMKYRNKAYAGGITERASDQRTVSGPGWMTLLSGVWANKHGVVDNNESLRINPQFPSVFKRIRQARPNAYIASIVNWGPINTFLTEDARGNNLNLNVKPDESVISETLKLITEQPADFTFIQLDEPDVAGHDHGFTGTGYDDAIREADRKLGLLMQAIEERAQNKPEEDWLVIVTTDHGREVTNDEHNGKGHGGSSESEKTIFIASNKPLNEELTEPSIPEDNPGPNNLYAYAAQTSVTPTVLRHMGIDLFPAWKHDGTPLLGETGVRKARTDEPNSRLLWNSTASQSVRIYRNGSVVAEVPAVIGQWTDPQGMGLVNDYVLELGSTPVAVRNQPTDRARDAAGTGD
ncbi:alkaline phosphatase family protein [Pseudomonas sp. PSKL.D1]|uniref:alkaline phosphatase family protein n=1 Tax=Pseudomonas sp. PSKL.D1 TaxID=3029060 RepID=UPI00238113A6|nr:alkaline phosphatase family protein [Pseudomonas sp. PSKL.D1]WDY60658.1 alkaline phosphatase family protein [Pseudomonas sp. PSKL.D1]